MERWKSALAGVVKQCLLRNVKFRVGFWNQLILSVSVIFLILTAACVGQKELFTEKWAIFIFIIAFDLFLLFLWGKRAFRLFVCLKKSEVSFNSMFCKNIGIFFSIFICFLERIVQIDDFPKWDSATYYSELIKACKNFDFTFSQYWNDFAAAGHPTRAYFGILSIGEFLLPNRFTGVFFINLILCLLAVFCLYRILEKYIRQSSWMYIMVITVLSFTAPLLLGTFSCLHPDNGLIYFFCYMVYCYLYQKNFLMIFNMALLLQTKEVGVLLVGGFLIGICLNRVILGRESSFWKRCYSLLKSFIGRLCVAGVLAAGVYLAVKLRTGFTMWSFGDSISPYMSTFSFQPVFIVYKWKQIFCLNFNWLIWGSNLIFLFVFLVRFAKENGSKKDGFTYFFHFDDESIQKRDALFGMTIAAIISIAFYCSYITFALPRYQVFSDFYAIVFWGIFLHKASSSRNAKMILACALGGILLCQAYITVDPISMAIFGTENTGNSRIIARNLKNGDAQREYCVYNHQFNYLTKAVEYILRDVGYYEGMDVLCRNHLVQDALFSAGEYWDPELKKKTLRKEETVDINSIIGNMIEEVDISKLNSEAVYIVLPQYGDREDSAEEFLNQYYEIRYKESVSIPFGGTAIYYVCDLIGERIQ